MGDASNNPAHYGDNLCRGTGSFGSTLYRLTSYAAVACEVLARKIVHASPRDRLAHIMSTRYKYKDDDAEFAVTSSALELAIDQEWSVLYS